MITRIMISVGIALVAAVAFGFVAHEAANAIKDFPPVTDASLCYSFDSPEERARFIRFGAIFMGAVFGAVTLASLTIATVVRKKREERDSEPAPRHEPSKAAAAGDR